MRQPIRDIEHFLRLLKTDPRLPRPEPLEPLRSFEVVAELKSAMRHYDWARLELGIVSRRQLQAQNSALANERILQMQIDWRTMQQNGTKPRRKLPPR
ncbi:MAG: hypothetical protein LBT53_00220 [Puniceicoccales bacterium]|jgi:hypothetical protein|nr:hypothetical protein [Puniceicoccales bacterium]